MRKVSLGLTSGLGLGLLDGASAAFDPEARSMLALIVVAATVKGALTGGSAGLAARKITGLARNVAAGAIIGCVLSVLVAIPAGEYVAIVVPGVILGMLVGGIVATWGD